MKAWRTSSNLPLKKPITLLAKMFKLAEAWGMTPLRRNPCRSVRRYQEHRRERFLSPEEYRRLGRVLDEAETSGRFLPSGVFFTNVRRLIISSVIGVLSGQSLVSQPDRTGDRR